MVEVATRVLPYMSTLLTARDSMDAGAFVDIAEAIQGTLVLAQDPVRKAGPYHAMDFARGLSTWRRAPGREGVCTLLA